MIKRRAIIVGLLVILLTGIIAMACMMSLVSRSLIESKLGQVIQGTCKIEEFSFNMWKGEFKAKGLLVRSVQSPGLVLSIGKIEGAYSPFALLVRHSFKKIFISDMHLTFSLDNPAERESSLKERDIHDAKDVQRHVSSFSFDTFAILNSSITFTKTVHGVIKTLRVDQINIRGAAIAFPFSRIKKNMRYTMGFQINGGLAGEVNSVASPQMQQENPFTVLFEIKRVDLAVLSNFFISSEMFSVTQGMWEGRGKVVVNKGCLSGDAVLGLSQVMIEGEKKGPAGFLEELFRHNPNMVFSLAFSGTRRDPLAYIHLEECKWISADQSGIVLKNISCVMHLSDLITKRQCTLTEGNIREFAMHVVQTTEGKILPFESSSTTAKEASMQVPSAYTKESSFFGDEHARESRSETALLPVFHFFLSDLHVTKGSVLYKDYHVSSDPARIRFDEVDMSAQNIQWPLSPENVMKVQVSALLNHGKTGTLSLKGQVHGLPQVAALRFSGDISCVDIPYFRKYYDPWLKMNIEQGKMTIQSEGMLHNDQLDVTNQVHIADLLVSSKTKEGMVYGFPEKNVNAYLRSKKKGFTFTVHIQGDMKNPQFSMDEVFRKAFVKELLGSLFGPQALEVLTRKALELVSEVVSNPQEALQKIDFIGIQKGLKQTKDALKKTFKDTSHTESGEATK